MPGFFSPADLMDDKPRQSRIPECGRCGLYKKCESPKMKPSGEGKHRIMFVGEAPGEHEDRQGTQLVGKTGQHLRDTLWRIAKLDLDDCVKHNAVICRPPGNEVLPLHIDSCRPNLLNAVRDYTPRVIVLLGGSAVRGLIPAERAADVGAISRWVGWRIPSHEHSAWICPTWHPSYLLRMQKDTVLQLLFEEHLKAALRLEHTPISSPSLEELKKQVECIANPREAAARLRDLRASKGGMCAFDYESNSIKPDRKGCKLLAVSFCLEGQGTFSVPWSDDVQYLVTDILRMDKFRFVASNLQNEERWTRAIMGHGVRNWDWDTMLAAHTLDNRKNISGLKFQSYVNFGIADYDKVFERYLDSDDQGFNKVEQCPLLDLLLYNGLDSLLEFMLARRQKKKMGWEA